MQPTASQVDKWAMSVWPGSSPRARLRRAACKVLFQQKEGPAGAYSLHTPHFRERLKASIPDAWNTVEPVAGSYVKAVVLGATHIFKVQCVPEDSEGAYKAIQLDVEALELSADDQQDAHHAHNGTLMEPAPAAAASPPYSPGAKSIISCSSDGCTASQQLGICLLATCLYLPTASTSHLSELRLKAAYLLAHRPTGPLGPYSCMGSDLGSELLAVAKDAWNSIPANQSKLKMVADHCLVLEPHNGNVAMHLNVQELERQAARLVADEVSTQVGLPLTDDLPCMARCFCQPPFLPKPATAKRAQPSPEPQTPNMPVAASRRQTPEQWEAECSLTATPDVASTTDNDVWMLEDSAQAAVTGDNHAWLQAMCLACLSIWWPSSPHVTAVALSIIAQPNNVARLRGTRRIARLPFVIKDVTRFARNWGKPIGRPPRQMLDREPFISIRTVDDVEVVQLDCEGMARSVLQAAAQAYGSSCTKVIAATATKATWPPKQLHTVPVLHLHLECHALVQHVLHVLGKGDGAEARHAMLADALQQLAAMIGQQWPPPGAITPRHSPAAATMPSVQTTSSGRQVPQLPLYRIMQQAQATYAAVPEPKGQLQCAAAMHLAAAPVEGPLGAYSMNAEQLSHALSQEQPELWQAWCQAQGGDVGLQVCMLLHGVPGFYLAAATLDEGTASQRLDYAVRLELKQLSNAAAAAHQQAMPASHSRPVPPPPPGFPARNGATQVGMLGYAQRAASGPPPGFSGPPPSQNLHASIQDVPPKTPPYNQQPVAQSNANAAPPMPATWAPNLDNSAVDMQVENDPPDSDHMLGEIQQPRVSAEQICQWGRAAFPGKDALSTTQRRMVDVLSISHECGAYTASATVLGQALSKLDGGVYQTQRGPNSPSPVKGKMNLQALLRTSSAFIRLKKPPSDLWVRLDVQHLMSLAGVGNAPHTHTITHGTSDCANGVHTTEGTQESACGPSWATVSNNATTTTTPACGTALQNRVKAGDALIGQVDVHNPEHLATLAEKLYPSSDPYKKIKLQAMRVMVQNGQQKAWLSSKPETSAAFTGTYFMMGPQFGLAMKTVPGFMDLPSPKLPKLCENDPYLTAMPHAGNIMVRLDVWALLEAARDAKLQLHDTPTLVEPPPASAPAAAQASCVSACQSYAQQAARPGAPAPKITPQFLCALAERLYPRTERYREMKLFTVQLLTHSKQQRPDAHGVCNKLETLQPGQLGTCFMPGSQIGDAFARNHSYTISSAWAQLPSPKLKVLLDGDRFLACITIPHNIAAVLNVEALLRAAGVTRPSAAVGATAHTKLSTALPTASLDSSAAAGSSATQVPVMPVYKPVAFALPACNSQEVSAVAGAPGQFSQPVLADVQQKLLAVDAGVPHQPRMFEQQHARAEEQYTPLQSVEQQHEQLQYAGSSVYPGAAEKRPPDWRQDRSATSLYSPRDQECQPPPPAHLAEATHLNRMPTHDVGHFNMIRVPRSATGLGISNTATFDTPTMHATTQPAGVGFHAGTLPAGSNFRLPSQSGVSDVSTAQSMEDGMVSIKLAVPAGEVQKPQMLGLQHAGFGHEDDDLSYAEGAAVKLALQVLDAASPEPKKQPSIVKPAVQSSGHALNSRMAEADTGKQQKAVGDDDELLSLLLG